MLTIEDIRNPARKSGFEHVCSALAGPNGRVEAPFWRAEVNQGGSQRAAIKAGTFQGRTPWRGPCRSLVEDAAQDYCDHINGLPVAQQPKRSTPTPKLPALNLKRANHPHRPRAATTTKRTTTRKRPRRQTTLVGTVYLIGEVGNPDVVKIGWSKDSGFARLRELQTGNHRLLCGIAEQPGTKLDEYKMHLRHEADNVLNEWFEVSPGLLSEFDVSTQAFECAVGAELETA